MNGSAANAMMRGSRGFVPINNRAMRLTLARAVAVLALVSGCSPSRAGSDDTNVATAAAPQRAPRTARITSADSAMVVSASPLATNAGLEVLRHGGNARRRKKSA
jgi:hypothetical protein